MRYQRAWWTALLAAAFMGQSLGDTAPEPREITVEAQDGVVVWCDLYQIESDDPQTPVILLLHQSGSSTIEYAAIAPRLCALGFHCLAVDARGGGNFRDGKNRTVEKYMRETGERGGGEQAYHDFSAAVSWLRAEGFTGPLTIWGSSYSAGRMFALIGDRPEEFTAALSFSPGRRFARRGEDGAPAWAERVNLPVFMTWAEHEANDETRARFDMVASETKVLHMQTGGVHGASAMICDLNPDHCEANWIAVSEFLEMHARSR